MNSNDLSKRPLGARVSGRSLFAALPLVLVAALGAASAQESAINVADVAQPVPTVRPVAGQRMVDRSLLSITPPPASSAAAELRTASRVDDLAPSSRAASKKSPLRERIFRGDGWKERPKPGRRLRQGAQASGVRFEFDTEVVADDNITFAPAGEAVSDVIFRFRPGLFFGLGEKGSGAAAYASAAYRPTASVFMDNDSENSFDHDVSISVGGGGEKLQTSFDAGYRTLSEASVDVSERTDREVVNADAVMEYAIGGKTGLRAELGYEREEYDRLSGFDEWRADLYATYDLGAKTSVGVGYGFGQLRPDAQSDQDYQRALARADWQATEKLALSAWGGADFRKSEGEDDTTAVFGAELTGDLREGTRVKLAASRDIGASALIDTETYALSRYSVTFEQRLGGRITGAIEAGYEDYDYTGGGEYGDGRSDQSVFVRPALRYRLRDDLSAEVFYAFRDNDSSIDELDFENNQFGASVHYEF